MTAISREIDFHILYILLLLVVAMAFVPPLRWLLILVGIIPQGRILTRAFGDFPKKQRPSGLYLIANEVLVGLAVLLCLVIWRLIGKI